MGTVFTVSCAGEQVYPESLVRMAVPPGVYTHPEVSPDGKQVVFWGICGGQWDIWLADAATGHSEKLTTGRGTSCHPTWSPDGNRIAFSHSPMPAAGTSVYDTPWPQTSAAGFETTALAGRNIWILDLRRGSLQQVTGFTYDAERPAWSPDGERIACVVQEGPAVSEPDQGGRLDSVRTGQKRSVRKNLYSANLNSGAASRVTRADGICYRPAWDPSGTKLAYNTKGPGSHRIWTVSVDGDTEESDCGMKRENGRDPMQLTGRDTDSQQDQVVHDHGAWWSADGKRLLFHSDRGGRWGLWVLHVDSGIPVPMPIPGCDTPSHGTWDQAERTLAFDLPVKKI